MKLIIGLGNPGNEYVNTRHNVGHVFVDWFIKNPKNQKLQTSNQIKIFKSDRFMNESGDFVLPLYTKYNIQNTDLYIIHDDLDIAIGEYKIQFGRGPKDHNGLKSIDEALGTDQYWHVRIGVDNRPLDGRPMGEEYVLQNFSDEEKVILEKVIKETCHKLINNLQFTINNGR